MGKCWPIQLQAIAVSNPGTKNHNHERLDIALTILWSLDCRDRLSETARARAVAAVAAILAVSTELRTADCPAFHAGNNWVHVRELPEILAKGRKSEAMTMSSANNLQGVEMNPRTFFQRSGL